MRPDHGGRVAPALDDPKGLELTKVKAVDQWATVEITFFNQSYVKNNLIPGETYLFYGTVQGSGHRRTMTNPAFEPEGLQRFTGRIMPVYPLTAGVSNNLLAGLVERCLPDCAGLIPEVLPKTVREGHKLAQSEFSYQNIHFPASWEALELSRRRLIFEELFLLSCGMALLRSRRDGERGTVCAGADLAGFWPLLPFAPTAAQRRAAEEAAADMASGRPMNRLIQGDVGSGKTAVAAACAWLACRSSLQTALMAPTEILAEQHYKSLSALLAPAGVRVGLLTGGERAAEKRRVQAALAAG